MTNYVWSATDKSGFKVIKEVEAATAEDSKFVLLSQGYSNLELKQDEVGSVALAGFTKRENQLGAQIKVSAEERLKHRDNPTATYWDALRKGIGQSYLLILGLVFFTVYSGVRGQWKYCLLYLAGLLVWLVFIVFLSLQSIYYRKLIQASDWSEWRRVLSLVAFLKILGRFRAVKIPSSELTRYRAKALIGLGDLPAGLAEFKQCEGRPDCPGWLYKLFLGGLHDTAKLHDKAIEYNLASLAENPTSTAWLDLANRYARHKRDPIKARGALAEAEKSPLTDIAKPFHLRCRGIIAYLEGDHAAAKSCLEAAIELVAKAKGRPFRDGHLSMARAYLCCVLARQGDSPAAKKCFALARKYLVATKEDLLLAECRQLCGEE
jgi:tetratricopeptide (TPR) repeat protein